MLRCGIHPEIQKMAREPRLQMSIKDLEESTYEVLVAARVALDLYEWSDLQDEIDREAARAAREARGGR